MEVCTLSKGIADWVSGWQGRGSLLGGGRGTKVSFAVVGPTALDCIRIVVAVRRLLPTQSLEVFVSKPLGTVDSLYGLWGRDTESNGFGGNVVQELERRYSVVDVSVVVSDDLEAEMDGVFFCPLAFHGMGKETALEVVQRALEKTKVASGKVFFTARRGERWQYCLFKDTCDDPGVGLAELLEQDNRLRVQGYDIRSKLETPSSVFSDQAELADFCDKSMRGQVPVGDLGSVLKKAGYHEKNHSYVLEEEARLYIVSRLIPFTEVEKDTSSQTPSSMTNGWWPDGIEGEFCNCGLARWEEQREQWLDAPVSNTPTPYPAPVPYEEVLVGLASVRRTYVLPGPIRLPDLIDIYLDIWESQDGY
mmetsp:Transcript_19695/g.32359  ORF Transcript_19695/g.32359 Transcript_19695/m.32359 type:complete len:363 (-) Transcript_19695:2021-3109(-)